MRKTVLILTAIFIPFCVHALNNIKIRWYVYSLDSFRIIYQEELEEVAMNLAVKLQKLFENLSTTLNYKEKSKINVILADDSDIASGFAIEELNLVFIYSTSLYFPIREAGPWFYNVLSHELTHIIARKKRSLFYKTFPFLTAGGIFVLPDRPGYGIEGVVALYIPSKIEPSWFTEGLAQLMSEKMGFDRWDAYRDMILRIAYLNDKLLTYDEMVSFKDKKGLAPEMVYNQGFSFMKFLVKRHGDELILEFLKHKSSLIKSFENTFEDISGESMKNAYQKWKRELDIRYAKFKDKKEIAGEKVDIEGKPLMFAGKKGNVWFYVKGDNSFFRNKLFVRKDGKEKAVDKFISSPPSLSPDGSSIVYTRFVITPLDAVLSELRIYNIDKDQKRKTGIKRAFNPVFSPDGKKIYYVKNQKNTHNLEVYFINSKQLERLTNFENGEQITGLDVTANGNVVLTIYKNGESDIWLYNTKTKTLLNLTNSPKGMKRDVRSCKDGFVFTADYSGIFNIYLLRKKTGKIIKLTDLTGGGFYPYPSEDCSQIIYTNYTKDGFGIFSFKIENAESSQQEDVQNVKEKYRNINELGLLTKDFKDKFLRKKRKYSFIPNPIHIYPSFLFYFENAGLGFGFDFSDKLLKNIFGGALVISLDGDQYYSITYINRMWYPTFLFRGTSTVSSSLLPLLRFRGKRRYTTAEVYTLFPVYPVVPYLKFEYRNYREEFTEFEKKINQGREDIYPEDLYVKERTAFESYGTGAGLFIAPDETLEMKFEYTHWSTNGGELWLFNLYAPSGLTFDKYEFDRIYLYVKKTFSIAETMEVDIAFEGGYISKNVNYYDEFSLGGLLVFPLIYEVVENFHLPGYRPFVITGEIAGRITAGFAPPSIKIATLIFPFYLSRISFRIFGDVGWLKKIGGDSKYGRLFPDVGAEIKVSSNIFYNYPFDLMFQFAHALRSYTLRENLGGGAVEEKAHWFGIYITAGIQF